MARAGNFFFNNFENFQERDLLESLVRESIDIHGDAFYYCPRFYVKKDHIYGEDSLSQYDQAFLVSLYIKNYESYEGDGSFLSKFNLEIRDQITLTMARKTYTREIAAATNEPRPKEGDLIYSPMMKRMFVIKYVNNTPTFYQLGALQSYDLVCETFEYSNESFNTGIKEIDDIEKNYSFSQDDSGVLTENEFNVADANGFNIVLGQFNYHDQLQAFEDNIETDEEAASIIDWSETDPFSEGSSS